MSADQAIRAGAWNQAAAEYMLLRLADAYANACFEQGLNQRTEDPAPEDAREELVAEIRRLTAAPAAAPAAVPMCSEQAVLHAVSMAQSEAHKQGDVAFWHAFARAMWRQFNAMAAAPAWQPIETAPKDGRKLILAYRNRAGKARTVLARWLTDEEAAETDADGVGLEGGWYESIDNWGEYTEVTITEGEPSHWMLPPAAPEFEAPATVSGSDA